MERNNDDFRFEEDDKEMMGLLQLWHLAMEWNDLKHLYPDPEREKLVVETGKKIRECVDGEGHDVNIWTLLHSPFRSDGAVKIAGKKTLYITDMEAFRKHLELTDTIDIMPMMDGSVQICLGYNHLTY